MGRALQSGELFQLQQILISYRNLFGRDAPPFVIDSACARLGIERFNSRGVSLPCFPAPELTRGRKSSAPPIATRTDL